VQHERLMDEATAAQQVDGASPAVPASELARRAALPAAWVAVIVLFGALEPSTFLTSANFQTIFGSQAVLAIVALALLFPLTAGDYDLSIAAVVSLAAMVTAVLNVNEGWPLLPAVIVALASGALVGALNGAVVVMLGVDAFIATLGSSAVVAGVVLWISNTSTIGGISGKLTDAATTTLLGLPLSFYYGLVLCALVWYVLEFTAPGRRLLFIGRGREVARLSGVRVARGRWLALLASASIAAVAGVLYAGTTGAADPSSGASFLLPAYAAAFVGATSIVPGRFNPWGSVMAVYFLATGITGLELLGAASFVQQLFYGGALVIAGVLGQLLAGVGRRRV
jgi:ribose transport system permease protein